MSNLIKVVLALLVVTVVLVGCAPQAATPTETEKSVTIGILGALTGPLRSIGGGAECTYDYFTELNQAQGGIKYKDPQSGKEEVVPVKILIGDHGWDAAKCISLYERFKSQGMQFAFANGSSPTAAIYAPAARDKIPGLNVDTTCDPFIYDLPNPYLMMSAPGCPAYDPCIVEYAAEQWKQAGKATKPKIGLLAADASSRRTLGDPNLGFEDHMTRVLKDKLDFLGVTFIPVAPIDVKTELSKLVEKGVDIIEVEHWGAGASRVVISDAITLGLHKKGIWLNINWMPADVPLAEAQLFDEYNQYSRVQVCSHGFNGSPTEKELGLPDKIPGLKKAYDLCAKYRNGQLPEPRGGWYYVYGVDYSMLCEQAFRDTLAKTGYAGFTTEALRDTLFTIDPIDTAGLMPTFGGAFDPRLDWPVMTVCDIEHGHIAFNPDTMPWVAIGTSKLYPNLKVNFETPSKYGYKIWQPTKWTPPQ